MRHNRCWQSCGVSARQTASLEVLCLMSAVARLVGLWGGCESLVAQAVGCNCFRGPQAIAIVWSTKQNLLQLIEIIGGRAMTRTLDPLIKSQDLSI
jgi:hypothetical protein